MVTPPLRPPSVYDVDQSAAAQPSFPLSLKLLLRLTERLWLNASALRTTVSSLGAHRLSSEPRSFTSGHSVRQAFCEAPALQASRSILEGKIVSHRSFWSKRSV